MSANQSAEEAEETAPDEEGGGPATVGVEELRQLLESGPVELIDVRTPHEWRAGHLPGARHVPLNDLPRAASELPDSRPVLIYCRGGTRSAFAAEGLRGDGYDARALDGGALAWDEQGGQLEPGDGYVAESGEAAAELEARERSGRRPPGIPW